MNNIPLVNEMNALNNPDVTQSEKHKHRMPLNAELYIQQNKEIDK